MSHPKKFSGTTQSDTGDFAPVDFFESHFHLETDPLKDSEELFYATFNQAAVGITQLSPEGEWLMVNDKFCEIVGYSREDLLQMKFQDITHPDDVEVDFANAQKMWRGEINTYEREKRYIQKNGETVWVLLSGSLVRWASGEPRYLIAVVQDIQERKLAAEKLRCIHEHLEDLVSERTAQLSRSNALLNAVVEGTTDAIYVKDQAGKYLLMNSAAAASVGKDVQSVLGKTDRDIFSAETASKISKVDEEIRSKGISRSFEEPARVGNRSRIYWSIKAPYRDSEQKIIGVIGVSRDITQRKKMEVRLKREELWRARVKDFQALAEAMPQIVWIANAEGRVEYINQQWTAFTGMGLAEVHNDRWQEVVHPEDIPAGIAIWDKSVQNEQNFEWEYRIRSKTGEYRWFLARAVPIRDAITNKIIQWFGTATDIHEQKQLAEERQRLLEREKRITAELEISKTELEKRVQERTVYIRLLQVAAMAANESSVLEDAVRICLTEICQLSGWSVGHFYKFDQPSQKLESTDLWYIEEKGQNFDFFKKTTRDVQVEFGVGLPGKVWKTHKPEWIHHSDSVAHTRRAAAEKVGLQSGFAFPILVGTSVEGVLEFFSTEKIEYSAHLLETAEHIGTQLGRVVERAQNREALDESEQRFQAFLNESPLLAWMKTEGGEYVYVNKTYQDLLDFDPHGKEEALHWISAETRQELESHNREVLESQKPQQFFETVPTPDGTVRHWSVFKFPFNDPFGKRFLGGVAIDRTQERLAEQQLQRQAKDLARSNSELEQFAYIASHDLREPLRMISNYTELLKRDYVDSLDSGAQTFMNFVISNVARMGELIQSIMAYSLAGRGDRDLREVNVGVILEEVLQLLKVSLEESNGRVWHGGGLPYVQANPTQLAQVLQNLLQNALKFRGERNPEIEIRVREDKTHWTFSVGDNGIGIDPKYFDRIFLIFQRLHGRDEYKGSGIGLAICKKIVERHGGEIWVDSKLGVGSTFYFTLPKRDLLRKSQTPS